MTDAAKNSDVRISLIIPVKNGGDKLHSCLAGVSQSRVAPDELIVVADGAVRKDIETARFFGAIVVVLDKAHGPAAARNKGALSASGDILFFVDADVAIHNDAVGRIADTFKLRPDLAAVIGSYDDLPSEPNFVSQYKNLFHHYVHQQSREKAGTFWGACGAIRRQPFLSLGGFDEHYVMPSVEDIELGYRLIKQGHRIFLDKQLLVKHLKRWDALTLVKTDLVHRAIPWTVLLFKDKMFTDDLNLKKGQRVSVGLAHLSVICLALSVFFNWGLWAAALLLLLTLVINADILQFFNRKRGLLFMLATMPWLLFYYWYSGLGFALGWGIHCFRSRRTS